MPFLGYGKNTICISRSTYLDIAGVFFLFSPHVLFVMSMERYLGAYYPIFHCISVTKGRLLILLAILLTSTTVLHII